MVHVCDTSSQELEAGGSQEGLPQLQSKFKASLSYMRPGLSKSINKHLENEEMWSWLVLCQLDISWGHLKLESIS